MPNSNEIPVVLREQFWAEYHDRWPRYCRGVWGSAHYCWHRLTRWWKLRSSLGIVQLLYLLALGVAGVTIWIAADEPIKNRVAATSSTRPIVAAAGEVADILRENAKLILSICALVGFAYKTWAADALAPHEMERRKAVASLLNKLNASGAVDSLRIYRDSEARIIELCACVRRDAEEYLQLSEGDLGVLVVRHYGDGYLRAWGRDRPVDKGYFVNVKRKPGETIVVEALRLKNTVVFHDYRAANFIRTFGAVKSEYRSLFCMPITKAGESEPYAVLTISFKRPYVLWPRRDSSLERRLALYVELLNLFYEGASNHVTVNDKAG